MLQIFAHDPCEIKCKTTLLCRETLYHDQVEWKKIYHQQTAGHWSVPCLPGPGLSLAALAFQAQVIGKDGGGRNAIHLCFGPAVGILQKLEEWIHLVADVTSCEAGTVASGTRWPLQKKVVLIHVGSSSKSPTFSKELIWDRWMPSNYHIGACNVCFRFWRVR